MSKDLAWERLLSPCENDLGVDLCFVNARGRHGSAAFDLLDSWRKGHAHCNEWSRPDGSCGNSWKSRSHRPRQDRRLTRAENREWHAGRNTKTLNNRIDRCANRSAQGSRTLLVAQLRRRY